MTVNEASRRVMEKAGLVGEGTGDSGADDHSGPDEGGYVIP
jgi:hypothetical protein